MEFPVTPKFRALFTPFKITGGITSDLAVRVGNDLAVLDVETVDGGNW